MDSDGQHAPADIQRLLDKLDEGYDTIVAARQSNSHASRKRLFSNTVFNKLASFMTGQKIADLTSGLRAVRAKEGQQGQVLQPSTVASYIIQTKPDHQLLLIIRY
jgi:hypothetical protein